MDLHNSRAFTRRAFLGRGLVLASATLTVPTFLNASARVLAQGAGAGTSMAGASEKILVVVQLAGGNDGLNMVVPFGDGAYYRARPGIAIPEAQVLRLGKNGKADGLGLHPRMAGIKSMYDEGMATVLMGVGYPNPNRSHFKSMDIWHTAEVSGTGDGWLGRYFDNQCSGAPGACSGHDGVALGRNSPLAMQGRKFKPIAFETPELFQWTGANDDAEAARAYEALTRGAGAGSSAPIPGPGRRAPEESTQEFLTRTALDAQIASDKIRAAVAQGPLTPYPATGLGRQLAMVGAMIRAGLKTRVYYVTLGGFDTHAGQGGPNGSHANLLAQFSDAVRAFYADLKAQGNDERVLTMSFSEFGRRVGQNGSAGTDHGTAAPMMLFGPMVRAGVLGEQPSLTDLDQGDLKYNLDFRSIYAGVLSNWLETDARKVLGGEYRAANVVKRG
jgi:uncharacterized protein (DUF1501 family)